jgi:dipeptidyl aminopeptidase/acylaminoacyl peptidase
MRGGAGYSSSRPVSYSRLLSSFRSAWASFAVNVARVPCCDTTPADYGFTYEDVTFETAQGLELSAWYIPTQNGAVVITVHGAGNNRSTVIDEASILAQHGYGVLMG